MRLARDARGPIAKIRAQAEAGLRLDTSETTARTLVRILDELDRLEDLVLTMAGDSDRRGPHLEQIHLDRVVQEVIAELPGRVAGRLDVRTESVEVPADRRAVTRVVRTLLQSVAATGPGEVSVSVVSSATDGVLLVSVPDLDALRLTQVRVDENLGHALDLAEVVAAAHHGSAHIRGRLGGGTTVSFSLPRELRAPELLAPPPVRRSEVAQAPDSESTPSAAVEGILVPNLAEGPDLLELAERLLFSSPTETTNPPKDHRFEQESSE